MWAHDERMLFALVKDGNVGVAVSEFCSVNKLKITGIFCLHVQLFFSVKIIHWPCDLKRAP